ncbi:hypothetical protein WN943_014749 [Citrus x changshan-huyou]
MFIAALLSQYNFIGTSIIIFNSSSSFFNHKSSQIPCATALNSASALLLATTDCFLLLQVTKFPPTNVQYPEVDLLSITDPAQSASVYTSTCRLLFFLNSRPFPGVFFRYLRTL